MSDFDLIVLGSGSAGYEPALRTAEAGWRVAVVEERTIWGGTCNNRGCTPKKVLAGAAEMVDLQHRYADLGIVTGPPPALDWGALVRFKRTFTAPTSPNTRRGLEEAGVVLVEGDATFVDGTTLQIGAERFTADHVHVATGSRPARLALPGADLLLTSEDFLDLEQLPPSLVFVGGGYISFELAHVAARFGARVTILHGDRRPLAAFDPDAVATLIAASRRAGIDVVLDAAVVRIDPSADGVVVSTDGASYGAAAAVHGAGRPPAIDTLDLDVAGVQFGPRGVLVDDHLRSVSNPRVYAGGDAAAVGPPLSPVARLHGTIVADNLLGGDTRQPDYRSTPSVVFTEPPLAKVGLTESEAEAAGLDVVVQTHDLSGWFDARRTNLKDAMAKSLVERGSGRIVGVHLVGNHAEDLINLFALAIEASLTVDQFCAPIYAFPSPSDDARSIVGSSPLP